MKCLVPGINVKVLARAIHALSKIGDELYIEPLPEGISFRTVNSSRSAYASFNFAPSFFINYSDGKVPAAEEEEDNNVKCKVSMKSCLAVFKYPGTIDKHVETCMLRIDSDSNKLIFQFRCRYGIIKNHYLPIIECETLQAVYTKDLAPNVLIAEPKLLVDALHNFQHNQEEITFAVSTSKIILRNFTDFAHELQKAIRTELCLESGEFVQFKVRGNNSITFCLKEFRALLSFAESVMLPVAVNFETAGRPVVFVITHPHTFEVNFVLATLMQQGDSQALTSQPTSNISYKRPSSAINQPINQSSYKRMKSAHNIQYPCTSRTATMAEACNGTSVKKKNDSKEDARKNNVTEDSCELDNLGEIFDVEWDNLDDVMETGEEPKSNPKTTKDKGVNSECVGRNRYADHQSRISAMNTHSQNHLNWSKQRECDVTDTPTSSVSVVYKQRMQDTFNPNNLPGYDEIFAPDSDEEPD